jgi:5-methylcytosine-specific restriction endonuclease McrA
MSRAAYLRRWRQNHPKQEGALEAEHQRHREYYIQNRERLLKAATARKKLNRARYAFYESCRRARMPQWADQHKIKLFYERCPQGYVVDHIIPLKGKLVSGLHVIENLQYLTPSENSKKRNTFK